MDADSVKYVRVKAGSPVWSVDNCTYDDSRPIDSFFGEKLIIDGDARGGRIRTRPASGDPCYCDIGPEYLEPWNDDEHWDGSKWVGVAPKPGHVDTSLSITLTEPHSVEVDDLDTVIVNGVAFTRKPVDGRPTLDDPRCITTLDFFYVAALKWSLRNNYPRLGYPACVTEAWKIAQASYDQRDAAHGAATTGLGE